MTPDAVYEQAVEAMAAASFEHDFQAPRDPKWIHAISSGSPRVAEYRADAAIQLRALLAAHPAEGCGTCGGTGYVNVTVGGAGRSNRCPNPDCVDGRISGERVIVALTMEHVNDWMTGIHRAPDVVHHRVETCAEEPKCRPVYVERLHGDQEPSDG